MARSVVSFITSGSGGNPTGIGNYVQQLNQANIPAVICCNDGVVGISDILNLNSSVPHVMLFRVVRDGSEQYSVPDYTLTPRDAAVKHWEIIKPFFNPEVILHKDKIWLQVVNEVDKDRSDWLGYFGVEIAKIAKAEGFKVMLFAFASGEPEPADWTTPGMLAYLQYCATNPDQAGVALHEYSYGLAPMPQVYPFHIGRFQELYKVCDARNIARPKVIISEFGWAYTSIPDQTQVMSDIAFAAELYAKFPTVLGATIWYLGPGFNGIANKVQPLIQPVTQYTLDTIFPDPNPTEPIPEIRSFEIGWTTLTDRLQEPTNFKLTVIPPGQPLWYDSRIATGTVEAKHLKCLEQVPSNQCVGGVDPLILDGVYCFKIQAVNMASGTSLATTFPEGGRVTVPINVHWQQDTPNEANDVFVTLLLNGVEVDRLQHPELRDRTWMELSGEAEGPITAELRFQTSWPNSRDCFTDLWRLEKMTITLPANIRHEIHLLPQNTTLTELNQVTTELHPLKTAFTFSADVCHALMYVGNDQSKVVIWGAERWVGGIVAITKWFHDRGITNLEYRGFGGSSTPTPFSHWPTNSYLITQCFGANPEDYVEFGLPGHNGLDVSVPIGTDVYAARNGTVYFVNVNVGPLGIWVGVDHGDIKTVYAHLSQALVTVGQSVTGGQLIGKSGNTGNSTGPHLHFGVKGQPYIDQQGQTWNSDHNPWPLMKNTYQPPTGTVKLQGYLYDSSLGKGSDGQAVSLGQLNLRQLPSSTSIKLGTVPKNTMVEISQLISNGYRFCEAWAIPTTTPTYQYNGPVVTFSPSLHAPGSDYEWQNQSVQNLFTQVNLPVKFMSNGISSNYWNFSKPNFHLIRVFWKPDSPKTPQQAWDQDIKDGVMAFYNNGARKFEVLNEPNLSQEGAGLVWTIDNFGDWLRELTLIIKTNCPQAKFYFPGMSPGIPFSNQFAWTDKAWPKVKDIMSGFCLHAYSGIVDNITNATNDIVDQVIESQKYLNLQVPMVVSESSVNRGASAIYKATVYKNIENKLKIIPGIESVCWYVSSWDQVPQDQDSHMEDWLKWGIGSAYTTL